MTALAALLVLAFAFALGWFARAARDRRRLRQPLDLRSAGLVKRIGRWRPWLDPPMAK